MSYSKKNQNVSSKINLETNKVKNDRVDRIIDNDNRKINVGNPSNLKMISNKQKHSDEDDQSDQDDMYTKKISSKKTSKKERSHSSEKYNRQANSDDDSDDDDGNNFTNLLKN
jgi:hypothetical protein